MQIAGLLHGSRLLSHVDFPCSELLGPGASEDEIQSFIEKHGLVFVKPIFKGAVGKKGKAGLVGKVRDLKSALAEKERLYFAEHQDNNIKAKANGVTFEAGVPAEHEVYFSITDDSRFRAPTMTLTHRGGVDIEELEKDEVATVPFDALTGLKAFVVANALSDIGAPKEIISPLVQQLPKLWELMHHYGMTTLELNPIRMHPGKNGRLTPVACDFKCGFDRDDPRVARLGLPDQLFASDISAFEQEVNQLRTHQGQSDVFVMPSVVYKKSVEGFGITYIEAASYGKPSIGGIYGGESDAIKSGKTGYLCNGNDLNAIYETLLKILLNEQYKVLGANAFEFSKDFAWEKIIKKYINLI